MIVETYDGDGMEGLVVRVAQAFSLGGHRFLVGKYVRDTFIGRRNELHEQRRRIERNLLADAD